MPPPSITSIDLILLADVIAIFLCTQHVDIIRLIYFTEISLAYGTECAVC